MAATALGGAGLDMAKLEDSDNVEGAIGQIVATVGKTRATDMATYASALAPAITAAASDRENIDGLSVERAHEVGAVINNLLSDRTGDKTSTALNQLVSKMDSFVPEAVGGVTQQEVDAFKQSRDFDQRTELLRSNLQLSRQFTAELKTGKLKNAIREFTEGTKLARNFDKEISAVVPSMAASIGKFEDLKKQALKDSEILRAENRANAIEEFYATGSESRYTGQARKIYEETMEGINLPGPDWIMRTGQEWGRQSQESLGVNPIQTMIEVLERQKTKFGGLSAEDSAKVDDKVDVLKELHRKQRAFRRQQEAEGGEVDDGGNFLNRFRRSLHSNDQAAAGSNVDMSEAVSLLKRSVEQNEQSVALLQQIQSNGSNLARTEGQRMNAAKAVARYRNQGEPVA